MNDFVHVFIHHRGEFADAKYSSYEGLFYEVICDVDKWRYFEVVGIIKDPSCKQAETILYRGHTFGMFTLSDDNIAQDVVDSCKVYLSVHMYVHM